MKEKLNYINNAVDLFPHLTQGAQLWSGVK